MRNFTGMAVLSAQNMPVVRDRIWSTLFFCLLKAPKYVNLHICYGHGHFKVADLSHLKISKNTFFAIKFDFINFSSWKFLTIAIEMAILHHPKQEKHQNYHFRPRFWYLCKLLLQLYLKHIINYFFLTLWQRFPNLDIRYKFLKKGPEILRFGMKFWYFCNISFCC